MTDKERLDVVSQRFQLLANGLAYTMTDKNLENDALALQIRTSIKNLIRNEIIDQHHTLEVK